MKRTPILAILRLVLPTMAVIARLAAQDVTVSPSTWVYHANPPDQLPVLKHPLRPKIPDNAHNVSDIGYSTHEEFVDARGMVLSSPFFVTSTAFENDGYLDQVLGSASQTAMYKPAMRAGKPVNSQIHFSVIFNPASASTLGPDATPRLLAAFPIVDPEWHPDDSKLSVHQQVIWAIVRIDETGRPISVKDAPEGKAPLLFLGLKEWQFAPARAAGKPVAQDIRVPFILTDLLIAADTTPPKVKRQTEPVYPLSMRKSGLRGAVVIDFVVDLEGSVREPFVVRSLNPAFDSAAIEAVSRWKFEPGKRDGVPVFVHMQVPIIFSLEGMANGGDDGVEIVKNGKESTLPENLRADIEPKVRGRVSPVFPYAMLRADISGSAQVNYIVDERGYVTVSKVTKASSPEFGLALQAAVERFQFDPALKDGRPHISIQGFSQEFKSFGDLVPDADSRLLRLEQEHPERIAKTTELDSPPKVLIGHGPVFPRSLLGQVPSGDAMIELLVDEKGHSHLPRVVSASKPEFGYAAAQAVSTWEFEPPKIKGEGALIRVRVPFVFNPSPSSSKGTDP
jgi:TonB family protein